ncbi:MAG: 2-oxo acid dehydrogenase subunit E2 [Tepidiformaceae bacterium]
MAVEFRLPELGENIEEAEILSVLVKEGDTVKKDQIVAEVDSDKATVEVPAPSDGVITKLAIKAGDSVKIGALIFVLDETAGAAPAAAPADSAPAPAADAPAEKPAEPAKAEAEAPAAPEPAPQAAPKAEAAAPEAPPAEPAPAAPPAAAPTASPNGSSNGSSAVPVSAAPSVRQFAREVGVDVRDVPGSGAGGRISVDDVKAYTREARSTGGGAARVAAQPLPDFSRYGTVLKEPMSRVRRLTATNLTGAWEAPHVTHHEKVDVTDLEAFRQKYRAQVEKAGGRLTVTAMLLKIVAAALKANPKLNASIDMANQEVILKKYYNIGVAADTPRGLLVPVLKNVDQKGIKQIAAELGELAEKARNGKLSPDEMQGSSFTVSNLGGMRTGFFTPVINPPDVAILGVGRMDTEPVYRNGVLEPRLMMMLSLSYDHRLVDGADAARFVAWLSDALTDPLYTMLD